MRSVKYKIPLAAFIISFLGSLPIGVINCIATGIYSDKGVFQTIQFIAGVVAIEAIIILITLKALSGISYAKRFMKISQLLSIVFIFVMAVLFWQQPGFVPTEKSGPYYSYMHLPVLIYGMVAGVFNLAQIPFWTGWNLYLIGKGILPQKATNADKFSYVAGGVCGSVAAILIFIAATLHLTSLFAINISMLLNHLFPILLVMIGSWQLYRYVWNNKNTAVKAR